MPYVDFHEFFPAIAEKETRIITILSHAKVDLPASHYTFFEMFCNERGCDCRRVFFCVASSFRKEVEAVIAYGWESREYYAKWMGDNDPHVINGLKGPALNLASPQSSLAPALLNLFQKILLPDEAYIDRVKRHYTMFRERIDGRERKEKSGKKGKDRRKS